MEKLVHYGIITVEELNHAKSVHKQRGGLIGETLIDLGYINGDKMKRFATKVLDEI